jgi:hypothetical protein
MNNLNEETNLISDASMALLGYHEAWTGPQSQNVVDSNAGRFCRKENATSNGGLIGTIGEDSFISSEITTPTAWLTSSVASTVTNENPPPFPYMLRVMLDNTEKDPFLSSIVTWNPEGTAFIIRNPRDFCTHVLPRHSRARKFSSFQRQLNAYGFVRGNMYRRKEREHIYSHEFFRRDTPELLGFMQRQGSRLVRVRPPSTSPSLTISEVARNSRNTTDSAQLLHHPDLPSAASTIPISNNKSFASQAEVDLPFHNESSSPTQSLFSKGFFSSDDSTSKKSEESSLSKSSIGISRILEHRREEEISAATDEAQKQEATSSSSLGEVSSSDEGGQESEAKSSATS